MGINGGRGIRSSGAVLGGSGISLSGGGEAPFSFGNALQFDGVNDYITNTTALNLLGGTKTLGFWVKVNSGLIGSATYLFSSSGNGSFFINLQGTGNKIRTRFGSTQLSHTFFTFSENVWYFFVINSTSSNITVYCSNPSTGEMQVSTEGTQSQSIYVFSTDLDIGARVITSFSDIVMDEIFIYNGNLSLSQMNEIYNSGNGNNALEVLGSLDLFLQFNEADGETVATDTSGNSVDFNLVNFSTPPAYFIPH